MLVRPSVIGDNASDLQGGNATFISLVVSGLVTVDTLVVEKNIIVKGDIAVGGHLVSTKGKTPTIEAEQSCLTPVVTGTDTVGTLRITVDEECIDKAITIKFVTAYSESPVVTATPKDIKSAQIDYAVDANMEHMVFSFDNLMPGQTYAFSYHVIE